MFALNAGKKKFNEGDLAGAVERFEEAVKLDPNFAAAHYELGMALTKFGRKAAARAAFAQAAKLKGK
jgi:Flp pilus assembly protein TadD